MANKYLISYDLRKPDYNYDDLYAELSKLGASHIQDSVWAVRTEQTAEELFDAMWAHMHQSNDRLLVIQANGAFKNINGITKFKDL